MQNGFNRFSDSFCINKRYKELVQEKRKGDHEICMWGVQEIPENGYYKHKHCVEVKWFCISGNFLKDIYYPTQI